MDWNMMICILIFFAGDVRLYCPEHVTTLLVAVTTRADPHRESAMRILVDNEVVLDSS